MNKKIKEIELEIKKHEQMLKTAGSFRFAIIVYIKLKQLNKKRNKLLKNNIQ
jgi:hypothetical protein